ncbi:SapC family protein [Aestuariibacter sp. A3R04]|uniref:SapC family protein n=1 Tax=Aestuariibacter sp. A3R04 TaxID=2841571 RepID=UPI001C080D66|nr:SapC family protein [Aestuariibacter sp. A3R04]MBU3020609.1 SapC family protein [Aestuariibacter sp. A3R04]
MQNFEPVNPQAHGDVRIDEHQLPALYSRFHMLNVELKEAVQASSEFPLFFSKVANSQRWTISALCGLGLNENVFVQLDEWVAHYTPLSLQTLPFSLQIEENNGKHTLLIDLASAAVNTKNGSALFLSSKRPSAFLDNKRKLLEERSMAMAQTSALLEEMASMGLIRAVDLIIEYADNTQQRVGGLATVNEQQLQTLDAEQLALLNGKQCLSVLANILGSVFQMNRLIRLHNKKYPGKAISNIKLETSKA